MIKHAHISECGEYRYSLERIWDETTSRILFVMLNPSTADAVIDDPTIRRCIGFAEREGCGSLEVVNLFAFRATDPKAMKAVHDPVGIENNDVIKQALEDADTIVCAWGAHGSYRARDEEVLRIIRLSGKSPMALGITNKGLPKHPLYLKADSPLVAL